MANDRICPASGELSGENDVIRVRTRGVRFTLRLLAITSLLSVGVLVMALLLPQVRPYLKAPAQLAVCWIHELLVIPCDLLLDSNVCFTLRLLAMSPLLSVGVLVMALLFPRA